MSDDAPLLASLPSWMREQHRTLIEQLVDQPTNSAWIGVASVDTMRGGNGKGTRRLGGQVELFHDEPEDEVFVWRPDKASWAPELWIAPNRRDYRCVYARFIEAHWPDSNIDEVPNHVDHMFPKEPAKSGDLSHVRLMAIPTRSNTSAGTLEKQMQARNALLDARSKETRMATLYSLGKALGYVGYKGLKTPEGRRRIAQMLMQDLRKAGVPTEITDSGLDEELLVKVLSDLR